jgi:hypothetical protein
MRQNKQEALMEMTERDLKMMQTLNKYPEIKESIEELCHLAEASSNKPKLADDAEDLVVEDTRKLGAKILARWAECRACEESKTTEQSQIVHKHGKKK